MTWICKKCGQIQSDSIIYGDEICDDCFDKIKKGDITTTHGTACARPKKKRKETALSRVLCFALVISLMLCIFSGFGVTASAEETDYSDWESMQSTVSSGTYMGYDVIELATNEVISGSTLKALYDQYWGTATAYCNLYAYLMEFDSDGKPLFYSADSSSNAFLYIIPTSTTSYRCQLSGQSVVYPLEDIGTEYTYINYKYTDTNTFAFIYRETDQTVDYGYEYSIAYTNGTQGFNGFVSATRYLVLVPFNLQETDTDTIFSSLVTGSKNESFEYNTTTQPSANFYTCKSAPFSDSEHGLWVKSWLKDGEQFPGFGWWINDNGNNHKYKVVFSYNDTQKELFEAFYESTKENPLFSNGWWIEHAFPILAVSKESMQIANTIAKQTGFADFMADKTWWLWHYNTLFTLEHTSMDFTNSTSSNKIYTINLSDYSSIYEYLFYKAQIIDETTGYVLDTVYFTSQESYKKSDSDYGSKVYDYGDEFNGMIDDLINNDPSVDYENLGKFDVEGEIIEGGILDDNGNLNYEFNINQIVGTLNNATAGMGQFFNACLNIIPSAFITILTGSFALIVVLRILGR